jgi:phosphate/sulfate permease
MTMTNSSLSTMSTETTMPDREGTWAIWLGVMAAGFGLVGSAGMVGPAMLLGAPFSDDLAVIVGVIGLGLAGVLIAPWVRRAGAWWVAALLAWSSLPLILGAVAITMSLFLVAMLLPAVLAGAASALCLSRPPRTSR